MSKEQYLELAATKWPELEKLQSEGSFYEFEKRFEEIWLELGQAVLENRIGKVPNDHRKKKKSSPASAKWASATHTPSASPCKALK